MERVVSGWDYDATNIPLRWSGLFLVGIMMLRTYRSDGAGCFWLGLLLLRTYRSDGAVENQMDGQFYEHTAPMVQVVFDWDHDAMNIPLRWSGGKSDGRLILRTYRYDGAEKNQMLVFRYGYTAPLERVVSGWDHDATNIPLRWSGKKSNARLSLRIYRSDGAGCFWLGS